jgi:hypothetical protein
VRQNAALIFTVAHQELPRHRAHAMSAQADPARIPDHRLTIEQREDETIVVRVQSAGDESERLPDAVFSFRCGDPQYAYWLRRLQERK